MARTIHLKPSFALKLLMFINRRLRREVNDYLAAVEARLDEHFPPAEVERMGTELMLYGRTRIG